MPRQLRIEKVDGTPGSVYYPLKLHDVPQPTPGPNECLVKIHAAALNHRDFFVRQHQYPGISFAAPLLSDGCGTVVEVGQGADQSLLRRLVILTPSMGWDSAPEAPEDMNKFAILGASKAYPYGMAQEYIVVPASEIELAPEHLGPVQAAALPLVGLTTWRALVTKSGNAQVGRNILLTGIGGGAALQALQFAVAMGCNVWVTSSDEAKIRKAVDHGAKGGVNYRDEAWDKKLLAQLPQDRPFIDAIIDGAGGDIIKKGVRVVKAGGVIVQYGMTVAPKMDWLMQAVLKHVELKGTTMGSRAEFKAMVQFVRDKKITPIVSRVVKGLDNLDGINGLFEEMKAGKQFGKLVVEISPPDEIGVKL
jgi:NADPH:quinone reductase-like Zn-dependent oxidoreductase